MELLSTAMDLLWTTDAVRIPLGFVISLVFGHIAIGPWVQKLWNIVDKEIEEEHQKKLTTDPNADPPKKSKDVRPSKWVRIWQGATERAIYTSAILLGQPEGIAVWLAFKAAARWTSERTDIHSTGGAIYLIGTALALAFGIFGGMIAKGKWGL